MARERAQRRQQFPTNSEDLCRWCIRRGHARELDTVGLLRMVNGMLGTRHRKLEDVTPDNVRDVAARLEAYKSIFPDGYELTPGKEWFVRRRVT